MYISVYPLYRGRLLPIQTTPGNLLPDSSTLKGSRMDWFRVNDVFMSIFTLITYIMDQIYSIEYRKGFQKLWSLLKRMGSALGVQTWKDPGDIRNNAVLASRNRYIDEQFELDEQEQDELDGVVRNRG